MREIRTRMGHHLHTGLHEFVQPTGKPRTFAEGAQQLIDELDRQQQ